MLQRVEYQPRPFPSQGSLGDVSLAEVLHRCRQQRLDGLLRIRSEPVEKDIFVVQGKPTFVDSNIRSETLAEYLRNQGRIDNEAGQIIHELVRHTGRRQQDLLLAQGLLDNHQLYEVLVDHVVEKTVACFAWGEGEFTLLPAGDWPGQGLKLQLDVTRLILDGVQQHYGEGRLSPLPDLPWEARTYIREDGDSKCGNLTLTTSEARVRDLVARNLSIDELIKASHRDRGALLRLLYAFYIQELVGFELRRFYSTCPPLACEEIDDEDEDDDQGDGFGLTQPPPAAFRRDGKEQQTETTQTPDSLEAVIGRDYQRLKKADYFTLLGVPLSASIQEIHHAFRTRSERYQPDAVAGCPQVVQEQAGELFVRLVTGYRLLCNKAERRKYQARLEQQSSQSSLHGSYPDGITPIERARLALDEESLDEAVAILGDAVRAAPKNVKALAWLAWALYASNARQHRREAVRLLERARKAGPERPEPYYFMALILEHEGARDRALQLCEVGANFSKQDLEIAREAHLMALRLRKARGPGVSTIPPSTPLPTGVKRLAPREGSQELPQSPLHQDVGEMLGRFLSRSKMPERE